MHRTTSNPPSNPDLGPSHPTRFRNPVGPERLERIIAGLVEALIEGGIIHISSIFDPGNTV
ncbi:MAG: hypothetical protein NWE88_10435 [Candidatus Bathyarchaeota archaeon]|nr:hypothetical protein [Candidatus Bathyarchaeota archaeon]